MLAVLFFTFGWAVSFASAQEPEAKPTDSKAGEAKAGDAKTAPSEPESDKPILKYPLNVAVQGDDIYIVDLDLPGVWHVNGDKRELFVQGTKFLRKPMNRPRCVAIHPDGGILVGDSATREVYYIAKKDAEPKPLCNAHLGIAMALAVAPDKQSFYVGDAEKRATFRVPIGGGDPELIVRVNSRGLAFDESGTLWAVTPDDAAIHSIDVAGKTSKPVVTDVLINIPMAWFGQAITAMSPMVMVSRSGDSQRMVKPKPGFTGYPLKGPVGSHWMPSRSMSLTQSSCNFISLIANQRRSQIACRIGLWSENQAAYCYRISGAEGGS